MSASAPQTEAALHRVGRCIRFMGDIRLRDVIRNLGNALGSDEAIIFKERLGICVYPESAIPIELYDLASKNLIKGERVMPLYLEMWKIGGEMGVLAEAFLRPFMEFNFFKFCVLLAVVIPPQVTSVLLNCFHESSSFLAKRFPRDTLDFYDLLRDQGFIEPEQINILMEGRFLSFFEDFSDYNRIINHYDKGEHLKVESRQCYMILRMDQTYSPLPNINYPECSRIPGIIGTWDNSENIRRRLKGIFVCCNCGYFMSDATSFRALAHRAFPCSCGFFCKKCVQYGQFPGSKCVRCHQNLRESRRLRNYIPYCDTDFLGYNYYHTSAFARMAPALTSTEVLAVQTWQRLRQLSSRPQNLVETSITDPSGVHRTYCSRDSMSFFTPNICCSPETPLPASAPTWKETVIEEPARSSPQTAQDPPVGEIAKTVHECRICFDKEANTVFLPCGHASFCGNCSRDLVVCPLCRDVIAVKHRIYL